MKNIFSLVIEKTAANYITFNDSYGMDMTLIALTGLNKIMIHRKFELDKNYKEDLFILLANA